MRPVRLLFLLLILLLLTVIGLWMIASPEAVTGMAHPDFSTMRKSGESVSVFQASKWLSFFFGFFVMAILCVSMTIGYLKNGRLGSGRPWLLWGSIIYLIIFIVMVVSYWNYIESGSASYFMGFPAPTAWMIYGVWLFPFIFTILYISRFEELIISPENVRRFKVLVEANKKDKPS